MESLPDVSIIGLGKLGAPMLACFAAKGFKVTGADVMPERVETINRGTAPVYETGLQEMLTAAQGRYRATTDIKAAVAQSSVTFVIVPTPSLPDGTFSLEYSLPAFETIGQALREKDGFHLVVMTSTVMPGATDSAIKTTLETASGKRVGVDFGLCYSPEFIALGSVIDDFLNPDFILIGESDARSGDMLAQIYATVCDNNPPAQRMSFVNAELTKIAVNTFITTKITFANMLARMCENLPESNVDVVTAALGMDTRIGSKYLTGAIGYGGPCFPRDNVAFAALAREIGSPATLAEATDQFNRLEISRLTDLIKAKRPDNGVIGILGLSYKPNTDVIEEAQGLLLAKSLAGEAIPVIVYDPAALDNARRALGTSVQYADTLEAVLQAADVVVVVSAWEQFKHISPDMLAQSGASVLIDCWRMLDGEALGAVLEYVPLGVGAGKPQFQSLTEGSRL